MRGVVAELQADGHAVAPARLEIAGDVPRGAGLSSSAALETALCLALGAGDRVALARLCSRVENDWDSAHTGLLEQLASLLGRAGHALRLDFGSLEVTPVALELGDWRLVAVDSGEQIPGAEKPSR